MKMDTKLDFEVPVDVEGTVDMMIRGELRGGMVSDE
jgi:hypothetical protein